MASPLDPQRWQGLLDDCVADDDTPGAVLGIVNGDQRLELAAGILNVDTGAPARPDAIFQLGSITKPYTASLVLQLAEEGLLDLDQPLSDLLPELELADGAAARIAVGRLLSHTSGIDGDYFVDTGRGDEALARYAESFGGLSPLSPPGAVMSYCNSGFALAGRIVEKLTGETWEQAVRTRFLDPAALRSTAVLAEDLLRFPIAYGHVTDADERVRTAPGWTPPRSLGPAGYISSTIGDLLDFAAVFHRQGAAPGGIPILSPGSVAAMTRPVIAVPEPWLMGSHWGLGWALRESDGVRMFGHDGDGIGHCSYLWIVPELELTFGLMTNHKSSRGLFRRVANAVLGELAQLRLPGPPPPPDPVPQVDPEPYVGTYERAGFRLEVLAENRGLRLRSTPTGPAWFGSAVSEMALTPLDVDRELFIVGDPDEDPRTAVAFLSLAGTRYLHFGLRTTPRRA